jgi:hypothetical protein
LVGFDWRYFLQPRNRLIKADFHVPCIFPWDIIRNGQFIPESEFSLRRDGPENCSRDLYSLFKNIWVRARNEVQSANRISFVGMSGHSFLEEGFSYIFKGKNSGECDFLCERRQQRLRIIQGGLFESHDARGAIPDNASKDLSDQVKLGEQEGKPLYQEKELVVHSRYDFSEFINTEIDPPR